MTRYRFIDFIDANRVEVGVRRCCRAVDVSPFPIGRLRLAPPLAPPRSSPWSLVPGRSPGMCRWVAAGRDRSDPWRKWWRLRRSKDACRAAAGLRRQGWPQAGGAAAARGRAGWLPPPPAPPQGVDQGLTRRDPGAVAAPDLVKRQFGPPRPDRIWHGDDTELPTEAGKLSLAVLLDGCSRLVVGHAVGERATAALAIGVGDRRVGVGDRRVGAGDQPPRSRPGRRAGPPHRSGQHHWVQGVVATLACWSDRR